MRPLPIFDVPDPELADTSYLPFKPSSEVHRQAMAEAEARAEEIAATPPASRFILLREDGTEAMGVDDLCAARAWQRISVGYFVVISEDGRLMSFPGIRTEEFAESVVTKWRERQAPEEPASEVRMVQT